MYVRLSAQSLAKRSTEIKRRLMIASLASAVAGVFVLGLLAWTIRRKHRSKRTDLRIWEAEIDLPFFDFTAVAAATGNFSEGNLIGAGGFGYVYKGYLQADKEVAISDFGLARIVAGSDKESRTRRIIGTYGYMSPEYAFNGRFSEKSDVFSFGVLLLEVVSGQRNREFDHQDNYHHLLGHAWLLWREGRELELIHKPPGDSTLRSQMKRSIHVGLLCIQKNSEDRPSMSSVVFMLANEGTELPEPKQPGFFIEGSLKTTPDITSSRELCLQVDGILTMTMPQVR
ncbi:hypothetical protein MLD38_035229 [Melastoma candidum]|uniref:Uncharacterized protein n=1 Tax=Melastoma candidum TaxID=119954 RepID=A0ACB9ME74_9MYRT|nr:hypothetical protein MLD38_035229 [Melastoma candidum]